MELTHEIVYALSDLFALKKICDKDLINLISKFF